MPARVTPFSKHDLVTTAPAAIVTLSAIYIFPITFAPTPKRTLFPITGQSSSS